MAGSVNRAIVVGNLGRDPEVRNTQGGDKIVNLAVATNETWNDKASGERKEKTEWHRIAVFNERAADFAESYLKKGAKVYVEGSLQTRKWADQSGQERYTTEIVVGRFDGQLVSLEKAPSDQVPAPRGGSTGTRPTRPSNLDDEIPFGAEWR